MTTQDTAKAIAAIEAAGMLVQTVGGEIRVYDPRRRGAYAVIVSGYCDATCDDYCLPEQPEKKSGKKSTGEHQSDVRRILAADRE